jgi:Tol biopolymer transport system component
MFSSTARRHPRPTSLHGWTVSMVAMIVLVVIAAAPAFGAGTKTSRVNVASSGEQADWYSYDPHISADGRYVVFYSAASNLVPGDTNEELDVFVNDRVSGETTRVSVASDGTQATGRSDYSTISADGRYVAFYSQAANLVPDDTNGATDAFVHDRVSGKTTRVSVDSSGAQVSGPTYPSNPPAISADGRYVAFQSAASNLVPDDTNQTDDVFVRDRSSGMTTLVSVDSGGAQANGYNYYTSISADGRYVAFQSAASNLVPGDTNGTYDGFVHDRVSGKTTRVSVSTRGAEGPSGSYSTTISADGRYVAFESGDPNLVPHDTNGVFDVFLRDLKSGTTSRVSLTNLGAQAQRDSYLPSISADGRYVAFHSDASDMVRGDTNNVGDMFVRDRVTGKTLRVSVATDGTEANNYNINMPSISADGRYVAFYSEATNLVPGDTNGVSDVFVRGPLR